MGISTPGYGLLNFCKTHLKMTLCRHHFDTKSIARRKNFRYCVFCRCWKKACFTRNLSEMRRLAAERTSQENLNAELITFLWCGRSSVLLFNAAALQLGYPDTAGSPNLFISKCSITETRAELPKGRKWLKTGLRGSPQSPQQPRLQIPLPNYLFKKNFLHTSYNVLCF